MNATTIETRSGVIFDLAAPRAEDVLFFDIAWALAHCCRFAGHVRGFYSVAQHTVLASYSVPPEDALAALLHDAAEAYIGDLSRPLKALLGHSIKEIEGRILAVILQKAGLPALLPPTVKLADVALLLAEKRDLMGELEWPQQDGQDEGVLPYPYSIDPWPAEWARERWLGRFAELQK
jgi:hypothetical protein